MPPYDRINSNIQDILDSISNEHVWLYDWLVQNFNRVGEDEYQKRYKTFWRLNGAGLSRGFCDHYFHYLLTAGDTVPRLDELALELYQVPIRPNKYALQFSFCTKLCHMLDRNMPIYDSNIRDFYDFKVPSYYLPVQLRIENLVEFHRYLVHEYQRVLHEGILDDAILAFLERFNPEHFTDIKVIDSLIWAYSHKKEEEGTGLI